MKLTILHRLYALCGALLLGWYGTRETIAYEPASAAIERIEPSVRASPGTSGGSGSHFWYSGSHGGK